MLIIFLKLLKFSDGLVKVILLLWFFELNFVVIIFLIYLSGSFLIFMFDEEIVFLLLYIFCNMYLWIVFSVVM